MQMIYKIVVIVLTLNPITWALTMPINNPYPADQSYKSIFYGSFDEQPKSLDPAISYASNEYSFIANIYEPPLQFDYLQRPYVLRPLTLSEMPKISYVDNTIVYTLHLQPGIYYQPHPGFVAQYYPLPKHYLKDMHIYNLVDFPKTGTRELVAEDYVYQIKRLANPNISSPIYELLAQHILGFRDFAQQLPTNKRWVDLRQYNISGVKILDRYTFEITLTKSYQQFLFWLAMPFFAPIPWEVDRFYSQPGMNTRNLNFSWYPVGTGPFLLQENNPNRHMILQKNPNYHPVFAPKTGTVEDWRAGYLQHAGEKLPLIDTAIYSLEKESIPRWNKFLQGYYDLSVITADSFDQAIRVTSAGKPELSPDMKKRHIDLDIYADLSVTFLGFNMLDPIVGGQSESARLLRQAISIGINMEEYLAIFLNNRGLPANGPIPPGVLGYRAGLPGLNPYVFDWVNNKIQRKPLSYAKALLAQAGYPNGIDPKTGEPLVLHYDIIATGGPDDKGRLDWMRKQFGFLGISLDVRATLYNRFIEKINRGTTQIFYFSWGADYPDPENFLFLFYSQNGKVKFGGENEVNYSNPAFDQLFVQMKDEVNPTIRLQLVDKLLKILQHDAPWVFGYFGQTFNLRHQWTAPIKLIAVSSGNTLQMMAVDVNLRNQYRTLWNKPIFWPIGLGILILICQLIPFIIAYHQQQRAPASRKRK